MITNATPLNRSISWNHVLWLLIVAVISCRRVCYQVILMEVGRFPVIGLLLPVKKTPTMLTKITLISLTRKSIVLRFIRKYLYNTIC